MYFLYLVIVSPWKRVGPSFVWNWIPFSQGGFVPSLIEVGLVVLENKIFKYRQSILAIWLSSPPPGKRRGLLFEKKIESPLPKKALCQVWFRMAQWFLRRSFFYFPQCIFAVWLLSPLGKMHGPSFEQTSIPYTQVWFVPILIKIGPVVLEKRKNWKVYRQIDRRSDGRRTTGHQKSSLELSAQVS